MSLRANGSRECAPLTSASARVEMTGSARQSISAHEAEWIASSQGLLAMTGNQLCFMGYISSQALRNRLHLHRRAEQQETHWARQGVNGQA